jgi:Bacterial Ig-like domain (group 3)/Divergent InlB B-repeat domain/Galactose oxidase, central domain
VTSAEVYDPVGGTWTGVGIMGNARGTSCNGYVQPYVTALADGSVLAAGGNTGGCISGASATATAELFNLGTQTWSAVDPMNAARAATTLTTLPDGKVLVAGGLDLTGPLSSAELFDPSDESWAVTVSLNAGRASHTATLLLNGDVLIAGGLAPEVTATAEIFSPDTETTTALESSPNPSIDGEDVTLEATVSAAAGTPTGTVEFFDDETSLGTAPLVSGLATLVVSTLTVGSHELTAHYVGETPFAPSDSPPVTHVVDQETFTLSVTVTGPGTGTVTSDDDFINCGVDCSENYDDGSVVTLTAAAGAGSTFSGWSGDDCTGTDPCTLTMDAAKSVIATFVPSGRDLLVDP